MSQYGQILSRQKHTPQFAQKIDKWIALGSEPVLFSKIIELFYAFESFLGTMIFCLSFNDVYYPVKWARSYMEASMHRFYLNDFCTALCLYTHTRGPLLLLFARQLIQLPEPVS